MRSAKTRDVRKSNTAVKATKLCTRRHFNAATKLTEKKHATDLETTFVLRKPFPKAALKALQIERAAWARYLILLLLLALG